MDDRVLKVIYDVLTQLSAETASGGEPPTLSPDTVLFGKNSRIEALAKRIGGDIVQMSGAYWPVRVAEILKEMKIV